MSQSEHRRRAQETRAWRETTSLDESSPRIGLSYPALLGHFARVTVERDSLHRALSIERSKSKRPNDRLLELLGSELRGNDRYYFTFDDNQRHDAVVRDLRASQSPGWVQARRETSEAALRRAARATDETDGKVQASTLADEAPAPVSLGVENRDLDCTVRVEAHRQTGVRRELDDRYERASHALRLLDTHAVDTSPLQDALIQALDDHLDVQLVHDKVGVMLEVMTQHAKDSEVYKNARLAQDAKLWDVLEEHRHVGTINDAISVAVLVRRERLLRDMLHNRVERASSHTKIVDLSEDDRDVFDVQPVLGPDVEVYRLQLTALASEYGWGTVAGGFSRFNRHKNGERMPSGAPLFGSTDFDRRLEPMMQSARLARFVFNHLVYARRETVLRKLAGLPEVTS